MTETINQQVFYLFYSVRSDFLTSFFTFITTFGNLIVAIALVLVMSIIFIKRDKKKLALFLVLNVFIGQIVTYLIKLLVNHQRPPLIEALSIEMYPSFPSAHTMIAITLYFSLFIIVSRKYIKLTDIYRKILEIILVTLIILIPLSRLYLGVHWFFDVLGGIIIGLFQTLLISGLLKLKLPKHDKIFIISKYLKSYFKKHA